jgi:hypothetical protein
MKPCSGTCMTGKNSTCILVSTNIKVTYAMMEIFKTNVRKISQAKKLVGLLVVHFPGSKINFDLSDCDKILRVEGKDFMPEKIVLIVKEHGFNCNMLD